MTVYRTPDDECRDVLAFLRREIVALGEMQSRTDVSADTRELCHVNARMLTSIARKIERGAHRTKPEPETER